MPSKMRVYPDANVYVALLLGERDAGLANLFFKRSADCLFTLVVSKTTFAEVNSALGGRGTIWLQDHLDKFRGAGKLEVVEKDGRDVGDAHRLNLLAGGKFGLNDFLHALLAKRCADVFVTQDRAFARRACRMVKAMSLAEFLAALEAKPG